MNTKTKGKKQIRHLTEEEVKAVIAIAPLVAEIISDIKALCVVKP